MEIYWVVPTISYQQPLLQWRSRLRFPIPKKMIILVVTIASWVRGSYIQLISYNLEVSANGLGPGGLHIRDACRKRDWVSILCYPFEFMARSWCFKHTTKNACSGLVASIFGQLDPDHFNVLFFTQGAWQLKPRNNWIFGGMSGNLSWHQDGSMKISPHF